MVDVQRLRVYRAVVAAGSIHAAAKNLGYTPSAVSQAVSALSRETGLVLIEKVGRGIEPTAAGMELVDSSGELFTAMDTLESTVADLREGRSGSLSISYFTSAGMAWMPQVVKSIVAQHPSLRLQLTVDDTRFNAEPSDVAVLIEQKGYRGPVGHRVTPLVDERYRVVVPTSHQLATRSQVDLAELAQERWIGFDVQETWCMRNLQRACEAAGFQPQYSVQSNDHMTSIAFAASGIGIVVLPHLCTLDLPTGVVAIEVVNPTPSRSIHLMVRRTVEHTAPVRLAVDELRRMAEVTSGAPDLRPQA